MYVENTARVLPVYLCVGVWVWVCCAGTGGSLLGVWPLVCSTTASSPYFTTTLLHVSVWLLLYCMTSPTLLNDSSLLHLWPLVCIALDMPW